MGFSYVQLFSHLELGLLILYSICNINLWECNIFRRDSSRVRALSPLIDMS